MFDERNRYVIKNYQKKPTFSSFLPGIAGPMGVPLWCYYNNRGQAVCSFGARDRDHAIMEFSAAHSAYRDVSRRGFRTFAIIDGSFRELFTSSADMHIGAGEVEIVSEDDKLRASALYFGLPGERTPALVRILRIKNITQNTVNLSVLDGMPEVVCFGVNQDSLKNMPQLSKAWMRAENFDTGLTCFRVRASMEDAARVTEVKGCNFCIAKDETGALLKPIVQPTLVFGEDTSLTVPEGFIEMGIDGLCAAPQFAENCFPCCFLPKKCALEPEGEIIIYSLYGQAEEKSRAEALADKLSPEYFEAKRKEAEDLVDEICSPASVKTADPVFDEYCRLTYLDNVLRGGMPVFFEHGGKKTPFYIYSRKHGDPEREYNYFTVGGEYFAQGNGNFRDVNQNRRSDVLFAPKLRDLSIRTFFELIQTDGYNPLVITAASFKITSEGLRELLESVPDGGKDNVRDLLSANFTPGRLAMDLEDCGLDRDKVLELTAAAVTNSESEPDADFGEGYWCDHWTYNIDLIESYLAVYPECAEELMFGSPDYRWYEPRATVRPRAERYVMTEGGLRQYNAVAMRNPAGKWSKDRSGSEMKSPLIEKMLLLCAIKTSTLDPAGMGIEMEGGKPGWYDALNGLPGLLGSSVAETCELLRYIRFTEKALNSRPGAVEIYAETAELLDQVSKIISTGTDLFARWEALNDLRESYREKTAAGFVGRKVFVERSKTAETLGILEKAVESGIDNALNYCDGICPTYFTYDAEGLMQTDNGVFPTSLKPTVLPLFLEGPVHWLKLGDDISKKRETVEKIRRSGLYDEELKMYKVNASLQDVSFEAGRAKAFVPGWLENESVWLHMEYKYLLELLRSGLYPEFEKAFKDAAVPFLDPEKYGRSPLENVSFISSSANPDKTAHGRGFVARLSGSTAEFLQILEIMLFGKTPFEYKNGELKLKFEPTIPGYLMPENGEISAMFLGQIEVKYKAPGLRSLTPGKTKPASYELEYVSGTKKEIVSDRLGAADAEAVRDGRIRGIVVQFG